MPAQTVQIFLKNEDVLPTISQDHTSMDTIPFVLYLAGGCSPSTHQGSPTGSQHAGAQPWPVLFENTNLQFSQTPNLTVEARSWREHIAAPWEYTTCGNSAPSCAEGGQEGWGRSREGLCEQG